MLPAAHWTKQIQRLQQSLSVMKARDVVVTSGRTIPGEEDLVLGTGRRVKAAVLFLDISRFSGRAAETQ